jgi:hypothetical protein
LHPTEIGPSDGTEVDHGQCRICMLVRGEYAEAGLVAHLANTYGALTAEDEVRQVLIQLLGPAPSQIGEPGHALLRVLDRHLPVDTALPRGARLERADRRHPRRDRRRDRRRVRRGRAARRPGSPRGHVNAVLASHPGPKALFIARSTTGWVGWAGPVSGGPKDGVLFPLPVDPEHATRHIHARRMAEWWLEMPSSAGTGRDA